MSPAKADIIAQLQREILPLTGFKPNLKGNAMDVGLGVIKYAFPNATFPLAGIHEFCCNRTEDASASAGFISGIVSALMKNGGATLWIGSSMKIFPPALTWFGIDPDKIIFVDPGKPNEVLWVMEEALKCEGLAAVIGEMRDISFTASRRLQLAVEQSRVTGFILRVNPTAMNITACITRWRIAALPSSLPNDMPGVGFPRWNVELLKVRNGKPGNWEIEWKGGRFRHSSKISPLSIGQGKKTG